MTCELIDQAGAMTELMMLPAAEPSDEEAYEEGYTKAQMELKDAYKPRKGKWKVWCHGRQENDLYVFSYSCSVCGFPGDKTDYCPNCGARMEESE